MKVSLPWSEVAEVVQVRAAGIGCGLFCGSGDDFFLLCSLAADLEPSMAAAVASVSNDSSKIALLGDSPRAAAGTRSLLLFSTSSLLSSAEGLEVALPSASMGLFKAKSWRNMKYKRAIVRVEPATLTKVERGSYLMDYQVTMN